MLWISESTGGVGLLRGNIRCSRTPLHAIRLDASRDGKRSYHVIYPNAVFRKIDVDLKTFVLGFVRWLNEDKKLTELTYMKKRVLYEESRPAWSKQNAPARCKQLEPVWSKQKACKHGMA